jgi:hypothetical protein
MQKRKLEKLRHLLRDAHRTQIQYLIFFLTVNALSLQTQDVRRIVKDWELPRASVVLYGQKTTTRRPRPVVRSAVRADS